MENKNVVKKESKVIETKSEAKDIETDNKVVKRKKVDSTSKQAVKREIPKKETSQKVKSKSAIEKEEIANSIDAPKNKMKKENNDEKIKSISSKSKKIDVDTKVKKPKNTVKKVIKIEKKSLDNELDDIFEESSNKVKKERKNPKVKSNKSIVKNSDETIKNSVTTKKARKAPVRTKSESIKKIITDEVAKTSSEKSSKIIMKKGKSEIKQKQNEENDNKVDLISKEINDEDGININYINEISEEKLDIEKLNKEFKSRKKIPKENMIKIIKKSFGNIIYAIMAIALLIFANYGYYNFNKVSFIKDVNIFAFVYLGISIMFIESAYKKEELSKAVIGLESLCIGIFTLVLPYIYQIYNENFVNILKIAGLIILCYYLIKSCFIFIHMKNKYVNDNQDFIDNDEFEDFDD